MVASRAWQSTPVRPFNEHRDGCVTHQGVWLVRRETDNKKERAGGINMPYITDSCRCQELRWQLTGNGEKVEVQNNNNNRSKEALLCCHVESVE